MRRLLFVLLLSTQIFGLPGDLDTTFGVTGGYVISDFAAAQRDERPRDSAIQADGKIVVVGTRDQGTAFLYEYLVARYNSDGTLDTTFSSDGFFTLTNGSQFDSANAVAVQTDGKIVVVGGGGDSANTAYIYRLNTDGTFDTTFSGDGIQTITASGNPLALVIQTDNKIVFSTMSVSMFGNTTTVVRLNTDGTLDTSFDSDGRLSLNPNLFFPRGLALQTDGKILIAGKSLNSTTSGDVSVVRVLTTGAYDTSFDGDGIVQTVVGTENGEARSLLVQSDGKILVGGGLTSIGYDPALFRYNANGSLDTTFDGDGIKTIALTPNSENYYFNEIVQQTDGKIVGIADERSVFTFYVEDDFILARFNANGSSDNSFDVDGVTRSHWCEDGSEIVLQTDGRIIAVGSQDRPNLSGNNDGICTQRFNTDGSVDYIFNSVTPNGKANLGFTNIEAIAGLPNGKIMVAGWQDSNGFIIARLLRLNANGTFDTTFMNDGSYQLSTNFDSYFYDLKVMNDGSFFVAGEYDTNGGTIVKFTSNGIPDPTFSFDGVATTTSAARFHALAIQTDGKIIGCGSSGTTTRSGRIARFSATGNFETSVVNNLGTVGMNNEILECSFQTDGKLVVAGYGNDGISENVKVGRHLTTLAIDTTFGTSGITTSDISATLNDRATDIVIQPDDKIVVSSTGLNVGGDHDFAVLRYEANGVLDTNFTENFGASGISLIDFVLDDPNDEANALLLQPDGQMIVGGSSNPGTGDRFGIAKIEPGGALVFGWGTLGRTLTGFPNNDARINALAIHQNTGILAAGRSWNGTDYDFAIARYQNEFIPTAAHTSVSGRVVTANGNGIRNVWVSLSDPERPVRRSLTGPFGYYRFDDIEAGRTYSISVASKSFQFANGTQIVSVNDEIYDLDFIALP
ncbi:MAG: carboxypeptidase regulatory-like domain-containing protein [Chloracidobacterium sp.]|nr:carboxypeptidase regulatory-like domain-containing protein [Chloracidobacterium sp.]